MTTSVEIYDTTLRDGTQQEGISLTAGDKLRICSLLDDLGVAYIEGGWPGANPKEDEFFQRAQTELELDTAELPEGTGPSGELQDVAWLTLEEAGERICRTSPSRSSRTWKTT